MRSIVSFSVRLSNLICLFVCLSVSVCWSSYLSDFDVIGNVNLVYFDASMHLYMRVYPSVHLSVCQAWLAGPQAWLAGPEGGTDGQTNKRTDGQTNGKSPHSTGLTIATGMIIY